MNILFGFCSLLLSVGAISNAVHSNINRNIIKLIVFKEKHFPKKINNIKINLKNSIGKGLEKIHQYVYSYNTLTDDDKYLIETIIDLYLL